MKYLNTLKDRKGKAVSVAGHTHTTAQVTGLTTAISTLIAAHADDSAYSSEAHGLRIKDGTVEYYTGTEWKRVIFYFG